MKSRGSGSGSVAQVLKRGVIFKDLTARLNVVPFPIPPKLNFASAC